MSDRDERCPYNWWRVDTAGSGLGLHTVVGGGLGLQLCNSSIAPVTQLVAQGANNTEGYTRARC